MNIADDNVVRFYRSFDGTGGVSSGSMYRDAAVPTDAMEQGRRDARGLLACVIFSAACWGTIGYFLLT